MEIGFSNLASVPNNHFRHFTLEFDVQENQTDSQWADCAHGTSVSKHDPASADDGIDVVSADGENYVTATTMLNVEEDDNLEESPLSYELQQGYRILRELMTDSIKSVNWPFMYRVDDSYPETHDYYERVQKPMWLMRMKDKFEQRSYSSITEFVADFRLMLENCYRYNGPDHYISKRGQKLETMLEQKLALLSRELRAKTTIAATTGKASDDDFLSSGLRRRPKTFIPHDSSALLSQLRSEEAQREREQRRQLIADRKAANEAVQHEILEWEDSLLAEPIKTHMLHSWELPQIGLFLFLCQEVLNLGEVSLFELERCLAMPRQSTTLQYIMTSLLSTPSQRMKIDKKSVMPYRVWTQKLTKKMDIWYKMLEDCNGDKGKAAYKLGFDPCSFDMLGLKNPLRRRAFHKNNFYRRIWILKCLCDHCLETQESLRNAIEAQPPEDQREYILGNDAKGCLYLHFPQFCGADLRIYRQQKPPDLSFSSDEDDDVSAKVESEKSRVESSFSSKGIHKGNSSLISSPEPRENGKKVKKRATRHPPMPEQSSPELATALWLTGTENRIRKTRNSVEASLPFILGNQTSTNGSWPNKRSKMANSSVSESSDKSCSNPDVYDVKEEKVAGDSIKCESRDSCHTLVDEFVGCDSKAKSFMNASSSRTEHGESKESIDFLAAREEPALLHSMKKNTHIFDEDKGEECDAVKANVKNTSDSHIIKTTKSEPSDATSDHNVIDRKPVEEECAGDSLTSALELSSLACDIKRENAVIFSRSNCDSSNISEVPARTSSSSQKTSASSTNSAHEKESVINNHAMFCNVDLMSHTTLKESDDGASRDMESSVRSALLDHVSYSMSAASGKKPAGKDDILEEDEEDNNEIGPDLDEFELIVDSVEGLQELIQQFAEPQLPPPSTDTSRKARKQRMSKPPQRKPCEVALHERLALLLKELQPWESKLVQASRRMRIKIRREFEDFKEEPLEEAEGDGWETETEVQSSEEAGEGDSSGEDDTESRDSQDQHRLHATTALSSAKKKGPSATPSTASDLTEAEQRDVEEYELDVSSRGRLRKRRLIPNNVEDQGIKKRKITKKIEETASASSVHVPNILQKAQIGKHLALSAPELASKMALSSSQTMQTAMTVENSHLENIVISQGFQHMQSSSHSTVVHPEATAAGAGAAKQNSHPEIQKLLSVRRPIVRDRYAPYKMVQKSAAEGSTVVLQNDMSPCNTSVLSQGAGAKGISITVSSSNADQASSLAKLSPLSTTRATKGASNHPGATMVVGLVGGKPHLVNLSSLPPSVLQQLIRTNSLRLQAFSTSSTSQNCTTTLAVSKPPKSVCSIASSSLNPTPALSTTAAVTCGQPSLSSTPVGRGPLKVGAQQTGTLVLKEVTPGANLMPVRMQGVPKVIGSAKTLQGLAISVTSGAEAPGNSALVAASSVRPHVSLLGSPGRQAQRYAGNVTVRTLLENRAGRKPSDDTSPEKQESLDEPQSPVDKDTQGAEHLATTQEVTMLASLGTSISSITTVSVTPVASSLLATSPPLTTSVTMAVIGGSIPSGLLTKTVPGVIRLPSQSTLDCAVRSVITPCMTTLPTANIKVPSPTTLPNLSPRKNVTKTVQSMKAPIPITTRINSRLEEPTSLVTPTSSGGSNASGFSGSGVVIPGIQSVGTLSTMTTSSLPALPGAVVVQTGNEGALLESTDQKQVLVRVMPQGAAGSHAFVQGIATSQGIVLPQTAILKVIQPQLTSLDASRDAQPAIQGQQLPSSPVKVAASSTLPLGAPAATVQGSLGNTITTNKTTAEVIRTMLAAKTSSASPVTPLSVITTQAASDYIVVGPQGSQNTTRLLMQAPLSSVTAGICSGPSSVSATPSSVTSPTLTVQQQGAETQGQVGTHIITTQLTNLGNTQGPSVPGAGAVRQIHLPMGQVSRLLSGIQVTGLPLTPQQNQVGVRLVGQPVMPPKTEKVMATSLPTGLQIRGLTGPSVVHLVSPGQAASGSSQPVVATLQAGTSGVVGLQQLQLLPSVSGFQKVHVISPQQAQMITVNQLAATSTVAGHQVRMAIPPGHSSGQMTQGSAAPIKGPGSDKVDGLTLPGATCMKLQAVGPTSSGQVQQGLTQVCLKVQPALVPGSSVTPAVLGKPNSMQASGVKMVPPKSASSDPATPVVTISSAVSPVVTITSSVSPLSVPSSTVPSSSKAAASSSVTWCGTLPSSNLSSNSGSILTPKTVVAAVVNPTLIVSGQAQPRPATPASTTVHSINSHQASVKSLLGHPVIPTVATRFQMTITPDPKTGHLTVRPQLLPSAVALKSAQNMGTLELSSSTAEMSSSGCPSSGMQAAEEGMEGEMGATERLSANSEHLQKGGLTISALGDGPGGLSGAVLASLSQMVGAKIARQTGSTLSAQDSNIQGIVSAAFKMAQAPMSPANQIQESSQALISLASHTALQQQQQQQPQTLVMKAVPKQINIPVTVSSGIYRVLPKTTPQQDGNQAMALTPSNSMVQSLKDPVTVKVMVSKANGDQKPLTVGSFTEQQHDETGNKASSLFPSSLSDSVLVHSSFLSHLDSDMQTHVEGKQSSKATSDTVVSITFDQSSRERRNAVGAQTGVGHLQRTTLGSHTYVAESLSAGTSVSTLGAPLVNLINGAPSEAVTKSMEQTLNSDATVVSGTTGGQELEEVSSKNSNVSGDILMEKEQAALNLLTLANQFHLN